MRFTRHTAYSLMAFAQPILWRIDVPTLEACSFAPSSAKLTIIKEHAFALQQLQSWHLPQHTRCRILKNSGDTTANTGADDFDREFESVVSMYNTQGISAT